MQITQFLVINVYLTASLWFSCGYNQKIVWLLITNVSLNLILFLNFYMKAYDSKKLISEKIAVCGSLQFNDFTLQNSGDDSKKDL